MSKKRRLNIVWSCRVRDHEHDTEEDAAECISRVTDFLEARRPVPPTTAKVLAWLREIVTHESGKSLHLCGIEDKVARAFIDEWS